MKTAYLGPEASFSHQAALEALSSTLAEPLPSFAAILAALQSIDLDYDYGLLPVENSTNGAVVQSLDLLVKCGLDPSNSQYEDIEVVAEHYLSVHHCLFVAVEAVQSLLPPELQQLCIAGRDHGIQDQAILNEVLKLLNVKTLYTHPQVWGQCGKFLGALMPPANVERVDLSSTSAAAAFVARHPIPLNGEEVHDGCVGAISSALAGQRNGLICIAKNIEDHPGENTTRFLVLRNRKRNPLAPIPDTSLASQNGVKKPTTDIAEFKSLITFTIPHSTPGSLALALSVFSKHSFNLTAIQSRPSHVRSWHYVFFVECQHQSGLASDARGSEGDAGHGRLQEMLKDLQGHTERVRWLGSWRDQLQK